MPEATGRTRLALGSAPMLTSSLCACAKALMKLNEAEVLRNSVEKKANGIARFEEAIFFSLKGEVKRQGGPEGSPGGQSWMPSPVAGDMPGISSHWQVPAVSWATSPYWDVCLFLCRSAVIWDA